jgi:methionyl-tRNA synthetase
MREEKGSKTFYITTTLPYVSAEPHVGFAMELIRADIIARSKKLQGLTVFFNTGTDEHGQKLLEAAKQAEKEVKPYVDEYAERFRGLTELLGISPDVHFVRTTDLSHEKAAQAFWQRVAERGYLYKKNYQIKYCVGCEAEKTESELVDGRCPLHNDRELELIDEENYFFKFSAFGDKLLALYEEAEKEGRSFVVPAFRLNEMKEFVRKGLEDFSVSRLKEKMAWGVPVPGDSEHVMYVWFDALVNYISTLGWPEDEKTFETFWKSGTPVQYCGKDNTRFQAVMWQAMLMAAELPPTHTVVVNGFVTGAGGVKMSKSLGNVVNPYDIVSEYGTDALRYFVAREISSFEDSPFTMERFKEAYNANLANGLGNLVSRIMKMAETHLEAPVVINSEAYPQEYEEALKGFEIQKATDFLWKRISEMDAIIQEKQPFKLVKEDKEKGVAIITALVMRLHNIALLLTPILPETASAIQKLVQENRSPEAPLFLRKD